jgi:CreA protein
MKFSTNSGAIKSPICSAAFVFPLAVFSVQSSADEVGDVNVDWLGGDIKIEAVENPKVKGVTCHVSFFDRGLIDRVRNGEIFVTPPIPLCPFVKLAPLALATSSATKAVKTYFPSARP